MRLNLFLMFVLSLSCLSFGIQIDSNRSFNNSFLSTQGKGQEIKKLKHLVLFKFKESATESDIAMIEAEFIKLPSKIDEIKDFEWGINISPENLDKGFTHCFLLTFDNERTRDAYLPHPDHKTFVKIIEPYIEDVLVIDYWTNSN